MDGGGQRGLQDFVRKVQDVLGDVFAAQKLSYVLREIVTVVVEYVVSFTAEITELVSVNVHCVERGG